MASDLSFTIELDDTAAVRAMQLAPARVLRATMRAMNRAGTTGRAEMARLVAKDMGMKVSAAKDAIIIEKAMPDKLSVRLAASRMRLPLMDFQARQTARGVTFRGVAGRQLVPSAFLATVKGPLPSGVTSSGHEGVFKRRGKKRLPIYQLFGVSIGKVFERHRPAVSAVMTAAFDKNLAHELEFARTESA
jgi:hypothetical protein